MMKQAIVHQSVICMNECIYLLHSKVSDCFKDILFLRRELEHRDKGKSYIQAFHVIFHVLCYHL